MDEARWLRCTDPVRMLELVRGKVSARKLRLFGCACCRLVFPLFKDPRGPAAVEVVERYADGLATRAEMLQAQKETYDAHWQACAFASNAPRHYRSWVCQCTISAAYWLTRSLHKRTTEVIWEFVKAVAMYARDALRGHVREQKRAQADLLRCIMGNPFARPAFEAAWRTPAMVSLARATYEDRRWEDMPLLGDALEEAGCGDERMLSHCRLGTHGRGCWVVDLLLGKK